MNRPPRPIDPSVSPLTSCEGEPQSPSRQVSYAFSPSGETREYVRPSGLGTCGARPSPEARCKERGCVFPAAGDTADLCSYHERIHQEPKHFETLQPTVLVLAQAIFGLPDTEREDFRAGDRRRLSDERTAFLQEAA